MRHFTLLLLSVFTVYQAKADILIPLDKYPTGKKRFNLQINGSHDTSTPWLSTTSFGVDEDGQMGNPENWTSEQIDEDNHSVSHRLIMNSISLPLLSCMGQSQPVGRHRYHQLHPRGDFPR